MGEARASWTADPQRGAVLLPAVAEAARRSGATAIGLIAFGPAAAIDLQVDRVGVTYDDGTTLGDPSAAIQVTATVRGDRPIPARAVPDVMARIGVGTAPRPGDPHASGVDATGVPRHPGLGQRSAGSSRWLPGDPLDVLPEALGLVPPRALPVIVTTWALSSFSLADRARFLSCLDAAATDRTVAWVSIEGVGVAPAIPTLGDRPASGHSIVGVARFAHASLHAEAVGRCWSRGRWLSWLADSPPG